MKCYLKFRSQENLPYKERVRPFYHDPNGYLWLPSYSGLSKSEQIVVPSIKRPTSHKVLLNTIEIGDDYKLESELNDGSPVVFEQHEHTLNFIFSLPNPKDLNTITYAYRLNNGEWKKQKANELLFENLKGNQYTLELSASEDGNNCKSSYGKQKKSYGMQITKHRVHLVNQIYNIQTDIEIIDLYTSNEASGTEVVLSIPEIN